VCLACPARDVVRAAPDEIRDFSKLQILDFHHFNFQIKSKIGARRACLRPKPYARKEHASRRAFFVVALLSCFAFVVVLMPHDMYDIPLLITRLRYA
jgi:hypothetical protein